MFKKLLFTSAAVLLSTVMFAKPVSLVDAKDVAIKYYTHYAPNNITNFNVVSQFEKKIGSTAYYYTFNFASGGFVMVAADDAVTPILGYGYEGSYDPNNIPANAQHFFDSYVAEIQDIKVNKYSNKETKAEWNSVKSQNFPKGSNAIIGPLCATTWDQTGAYATYVPAGTPTGCVATAMAQVMKKWNYPTTGTGSHSYTSTYAGVLSANFGATTYNWSSMPLTSGNTSVARLMSDLGISVNMDYETAGSGAFTQAVPPSFINYFNYQPSCEVKSRSSFQTDALWLSLIQAEIDAGRPCMLAGDNAGAAGSGHEWVCDGYNTSTLKFHMNWGWSGSSNAYFNLTQLNPSGMLFNSDRAAVIRIVPFNNLIPIANFSIASGGTTIPAVGAPVDFTDLSLNNPTSWLWTFDGGTPATSTAQNPTGITFATNGYHLVSLKAINANGSDIKTKERYIKVGGAPTVWIQQSSAFATASRGIDQIQILDANTVWAKAYDGTNPVGYIREFTKTNDGGATWNPGAISFTNSANYGCANIFAFDYMNAYACMFPITGTGGTIVKTTDGGATWNTQPTATFTTSWADFVHFFDANNGVCVGDPTATTGTRFFIYTTSNGGTTWTQISNGSSPAVLTGEAGIVNLYQAVGNTMWFTTNKGRVFKSTNMGATWTASTTGFTNSFTMRFKDANVGIAVTDTTPVGFKKTIDGGATWQSFVPTGFVVQHPQLAFIPGTASTWVDVASYPSNGSTISFNDGTSFVNIDSGSVQFTAVDFLDINTGWAGSFNVSPTSDGIYKWNPSVVTGIQNSVPEGNISIYPIPSRGIINVAFGKVEDENATITVYDVIGATIMTKQVKAISNDFIQLDLTDKDAGLYFITVNNGGKVYNRKVVIK